MVGVLRIILQSTGMTRTAEPTPAVGMNESELGSSLDIGLTSAIKTGLQQ
jgi:hypothetical protein